MCTPTALLPTWFSRSPLVMSQMWNAEVAELRCTWRQNSNDGHGGSSSKMAAEPTQVRAVWFQEKVKSKTTAAVSTKAFGCASQPFLPSLTD